MMNAMSPRKTRGGDREIAGLPGHRQNSTRVTSLHHPEFEGNSRSSHLGYLATSGDPAPIKRLLAHVSPVWLFEIQECGDKYYMVERGDLEWRFWQLPQARLKFLLQVKCHIGEGAEHQIEERAQ